MPRRTILLVDNDDQFRETLGERLELRGFVVVSASSGLRAVEAIKRHKVDLAVVDMQMPDMDGLVTIAKLKEQDPGLRTLLLTAHGNDKLRQATEGIESDYFEKSDMGNFWDFLNHIKGDSRFIIVSPNSAQHDHWTAQQDGRQPDAHPQGFPHLIGHTEVMQKLKSDIAKVASMDCPVLIIGESGSGKKLVGHAIHGASLREGHRFLAVNCGAFSEDYLFHALFRKGAQDDGQASQTPGLLESAHGGTFFLEELGSVPLSLQREFNTLINTKQLARNGRTQPLDVRILASSCIKPATLLQRGELREELYATLNVFTLTVPPLRERRDDILPLSVFFLEQTNKKFDKNVERFDKGVLNSLLHYNFPGNVRELENIVERAVITCQDKIVKREHLPARFQTQDAGQTVDPEEIPTLADMEEQYILKVLNTFGGNRNEAARALGISRASLWRKLKKMEEIVPAASARH